jgi:tetratricopeptide (TPR) repeat protein
MTHSHRAWHQGVLACVVMACCGMAPAQPQEPVPPPTRGPAVTAQSVEQKTAMVAKVLEQSPVAARAQSSQNEHARRHISNARELARHAQALAASGIWRGADALLNEAIWEVSRAQQMLPDPATQLAGERARFAQLENSVAALQHTAQIGLPPGSGKQVESSERVAARANTLVEQAAALARVERYGEANRQLDQALVLLLRDASARLAGHTIVYEQRFANRRDEFAFELDRFRSFEPLVPLALVEYRPSPEALVLIERYVAQARQLRDRGQAQAAQDIAAAIKSVVEGTDMLKRALQAAGLVVPQTLDPP